MEDCVFCKIVEGKIPSYNVYEDPDFLAFLDINPLFKGHTLVIPKKHFRWVYEVEHFGKYWEVAKKVTNAVIKAIGADHVNYFTLGYMIPHAHIHIVPRRADDGGKEIPNWDKLIKLTDTEMRNISDKIRKEL